MRLWLASWWRPHWSFGWATGALVTWATVTHHMPVALVTVALQAVGLPQWAADRADSWLHSPTMNHPDGATQTTPDQG